MEKGINIACSKVKIRGRSINLLACLLKVRSTTVNRENVGARPTGPANLRRKMGKHPSKLNLQLVQRTQELYPFNEPYINDPLETMRESRTQAQRELARERAQKAKKKRDQQKKSRKINRGR